MEKLVFNESINLEYPDSFVKLSEEENHQYFSGNLLRLSIQDKEKHILISISKSRNSIFYRITNVASVAINSVSNLETTLKEYEFIEEFESRVLDEYCLTECFSYKANDQDIKQYGELSVFKIKNAIFSIYCICRLEDKDNYKKVFKQFRDSLTNYN